MKQAATHGLPWRGYNSTLARDLLPPGYCSADSNNVLVNPLEGVLYRRQGAAFLGANTGVLEMTPTDATMRGLQCFPLDSPSMADGYPAQAVLFADEAKNYGTVYWRSTNGADSDQSLGREFSTTHYPVGSASIPDMKIVPFGYVDHATGYNRLATEVTRRYAAQGSRRVLKMGNWLYIPGTGIKWNRRYNDATGSGTETPEFLPIGHIPPGFPPTITAGGGGATTQPWQQNEQFYVAVAFIFEDRSVSMPFMPREINATLTGGLGLVTLPTTNPFYQYVTWSKIACGPPGTIGRVLLRSPKVLTTASPFASPDFSDLRIVDVIWNNTSTSYVDTHGSDGSIRSDDVRIRFDHRMPPTGRYIWPFDQRVAIAGKLKYSRFGVFVFPTGSVATRDINAAATSQTIYGSVRFYISFQSNEGSANARLLLRKVSGGSVTTTKIDLYSGATPKTLQQVVDEVNATVVGGQGGEWAACLAPDADANSPVTNLAPLSQNIACTTTDASPTVTTAASFVDVAVGMKVTGTSVPAGAYVKAIASNSSLTLSANAANPGAGAVTLTFWSDVGDEGEVGTGATDATYGATIDYNGVMRCYANSYPGALLWKASFIDAAPAQDQHVVFTGADPGHAPNAANNFYVGNIRSLSAHGRVMGGVPLQTGNIVAWVPFSDGTGVIRNLRGGGTALDEDYRLLTSSYSRGITSPYSVVAGEGWAGGLTVDGYLVTDGEHDSERIISFNNFDPARALSGTTGAGAWATEMGYCDKATRSDSSDYGFHAAVGRGRLWVTFRNSATAYGTVAQCYDFSAGISGSGLSEVLQPDGSPWPWSAPLYYNPRSNGPTAGRVGPIGYVTTAAGLLVFTTDDTNDKANCGLVAQIENGTWKDGTDWVPFAVYGRCEDHGTLLKKWAQRVFARYLSGVAIKLNLYRLSDRSESSAIALAASAANSAFTDVEVPIPLRERSQNDAFEVGYSLALADGAAGEVRLRGHLLESDLQNGG